MVILQNVFFNRLIENQTNFVKLIEDFILNVLDSVIKSILNYNIKYRQFLVKQPVKNDISEELSQLQIQEDDDTIFIFDFITISPIID